VETRARINISVVPFTGFRRLVHRISTGRPAGAFGGALLALCLAMPAAAQDGGGSLLFRIFLTDGRVLTSYGEWARLDDRVVFSMPLRRGDPAGELHLVSVAAAQVDWERTERYAVASRAQAYATARGEADFDRLSTEVADTLNAIAAIKDPRERLARAEAARRTLNDWPGAHYGYRAVEVREILGMLDEVIVDLHASAGSQGISLALIAPPAVLPDEPLLPEPTEAEIVEQLLTAADVAANPAERGALLQSLLAFLDRVASLLPQPWAKLARMRAEELLAEEQRFDAAYAKLRTTMLSAAARSVSRADVRGIERLRAAVRDADARLGAKRPAEVQGLLDTLDSRLESGRAGQEARVQGVLRAPGARKYRRAINLSLRSISRTTPDLEDVRAQAGPAAKRLPSIIDRWRKDGTRLDQITPPPDLQPVHALFRSAWEMGEQALALRLSAASGNDAARAQQASSAAAGALMLLARARADLAAAIAPPKLPAP
jgi:hypothetical protein